MQVLTLALQALPNWATSQGLLLKILRLDLIAWAGLELMSSSDLSTPLEWLELWATTLVPAHFRCNKVWQECSLSRSLIWSYWALTKETEITLPKIFGTDVLPPTEASKLKWCVIYTLNPGFSTASILGTKWLQSKRQKRSEGFILLKAGVIGIASPLTWLLGINQILCKSSKCS